MLSIDWVEGAPSRLEAGMVVQWSDDICAIVGHLGENTDGTWDDGEYNARISIYIQRWGWLIKPHELEWIEAIGVRKP